MTMAPDSATEFQPEVPSNPVNRPGGPPKYKGVPGESLSWENGACGKTPWPGLDHRSLMGVTPQPLS